MLEEETEEGLITLEDETEGVKEEEEGGRGILCSTEEEEERGTERGIKREGREEERGKRIELGEKVAGVALETTAPV